MTDPDYKQRYIELSEAIRGMIDKGMFGSKYAGVYWRGKDIKQLLYKPEPSLLPCRICKDDINVHMDSEHNDLWHYVNCRLCQTRGPRTRFLEESANDWNTLMTAPEPVEALKDCRCGAQPDVMTTMMAYRPWYSCQCSAACHLSTPRSLTKVEARANWNNGIFLQDGPKNRSKAND